MYTIHMSRLTTTDLSDNSIERCYNLIAPEGIRIPSKPGITPTILEEGQQDSLHLPQFPSLEAMTFVKIVTCIQSYNKAPPKTKNGTSFDQTWIQSSDEDWDTFINQTPLLEKCKSQLIKRHSNLYSFKHPSRLKTITTYKLFTHLIHDIGMSSLQAENAIASLDIPVNLKKEIFNIKYKNLNENKFRPSRYKRVKRCRLITQHRARRYLPAALNLNPNDNIYIELRRSLPR